MKRNIRYILALNFFITTFWVHGQNNLKVNFIDQYCDSINSIRCDSSVQLGREGLRVWEEYAQGCFIKDSLVSIVWFNAHAYQGDYYFRNGQLVCVRQSKRVPAYDSTDINKMKLKYADRFYFENGSLIYVKKTGDWKREKNKKVAKLLLQNAARYKALIYLKRKE